MIKDHNPTVQRVISITFPVFDEEEKLEALYREVKQALDSVALSYEMVFVDNGSNDRSLTIIKELAEQVSQSAKKLNLGASWAVA